MTLHPGIRERAPVSRRGFTLIEMLAVLVILAILGGLSIGAYQLTRRQMDLAGSRSEIENLLRAARQTALRSGIPVRVIVDPTRRRVAAIAYEALGEWSFEIVETEGESVTRGLFNDVATLQGASLSDGYVGRGVDLSGGSIDCGNNPRYDVRRGLYIEAWINLTSLDREAPAQTGRRGSRRRRARPSTRRTEAAAIVSKGKAYFLGATRDGFLEGAIAGHRIRTERPVLVAERWTRVALRYDGESMDLVVDGIPRSTRVPGYDKLGDRKAPRVPSSVPQDYSPLSIGAADGSFSGRIDEVRLRGLIEPIEHELGARQELLGWRKEIWFDANGHLDLRHHEGPVRLILYVKEPEERTGTRVQVDYSKTFREWARRRGVQEQLDAEKEEAKLEAALGALQREVIVVDRLGTIRRG